MYLISISIGLLRFTLIVICNLVLLSYPPIRRILPFPRMNRTEKTKLNTPPVFTSYQKKEEFGMTSRPTLFEAAGDGAASAKKLEKFGAGDLQSGPWTVTQYDDLTIDDCAEVLSADALTLLRAEEGLTSQEMRSDIVSQMTELLLSKESRSVDERKAKQDGKFDCGTKDNSEDPCGGTYKKVDGDLANGSEKDEGEASLKVGGFLDDQKIYFWANDSTVKFYVKGSTFPSQERFSIVEKPFAIVALAWTRIAPGDTSFVRVYTEAESDYLVQYIPEGPRPNTLASASPPAFYTRGENKISVYPRAFDRDSVNIMSNIMAHEFGHVVGLRHSFAQQREATLESASYNDDPTSVMSYNFPPIININDVKNTRDIYILCQDGSTYYFPFQNTMLLFTTVRVNP